MQLASSDQLDPALQPPKPRRERLTLGQALVALAIAFVAAHLVGRMTAEVAHAVTGQRSALATGVVVPAMLLSQATLLLVALLAPLLAALPLREALGLYPARLHVLGAATLGTVMLGPLGDRLMSELSARFPQLNLGVVTALNELAAQLPLGLLWPTFALMPGLAEELLFRGVLQRSLSRTRWAIPISGAAFALFHVDPVHVIGVLPLGLFLAWTAQRYGTFVTMVAHVLNNSVALLAIKNGALEVGYGSDQALPTSWLLASLLLVTVAVVILAREPRASTQA
jgi:uncharacterized protein